MSISPDAFDKMFDKVFRAIKDQQKETIVLELERKLIDNELFQDYPLTNREFSQLKHHLEADEEFIETLLQMMRFYIYRIRSKESKEINFPYVSLN